MRTKNQKSDTSLTTNNNTFNQVGSQVHDCGKISRVANRLEALEIVVLLRRVIFGSSAEGLAPIENDLFGDLVATVKQKLLSNNQQDREEWCWAIGTLRRDDRSYPTQTTVPHFKAEENAVGIETIHFDVAA